jgi:hypothetical protein
MDMIIYDKAAWHLETFDKDKVVNYFSKLLTYLKSRNYLNNYGLEIFDLGVDSSISITSKMLNEEGNAALSNSYDIFLSDLDINADPDFSALNAKMSVEKQGHDKPKRN